MRRKVRDARCPRSGAAGNKGWAVATSRSKPVDCAVNFRRHQIRSTADSERFNMGPGVYLRPPAATGRRSEGDLSRGFHCGIEGEAITVNANGTVTRSPLILLVDDYRDGREMYAEYLAFRGYRVAMAFSGAQAVALASGPERPAVVLMDLEMPGMSGAMPCARYGQRSSAHSRARDPRSHRTRNECRTRGCNPVTV